MLPLIHLNFKQVSSRLHKNTLENRNCQFVKECQFLSWGCWERCGQKESLLWQEFWAQNRMLMGRMNFCTLTMWKSWYVAWLTLWQTEVKNDKIKKLNLSIEESQISSFQVIKDYRSRHQFIFHAAWIFCCRTALILV